MDLWVIILSASLAGFFLTLQRPGIYAFVIQQYPKNSGAVSAVLLFVQFTLGFVSLTVGPLIWTEFIGKVWFFGSTAILTLIMTLALIFEMIKKWNVK